jgi:hypothetical protein
MTNKANSEPEEQAPERIWIRPASMEYSTMPLNYDDVDVEYVRANLASSSVTAPQGVEGWRTMESAPRDSSWILAVMRTGKQAVVRWGGGTWEDDNRLCRDPVQWMSLPPVRSGDNDPCIVAGHHVCGSGGDMVPRSRWEATNADWLREMRAKEELQVTATREIEKLTRSTKHLARSTAELLTRAETAESALTNARSQGFTAGYERAREDAKGICQSGAALAEPPAGAPEIVRVLNAAADAIAALRAVPKEKNEPHK